MLTPPEVPGDVEPEDSNNNLEGPAIFALAISRTAIDQMLKSHGLCPTDEIRFTVAQELKKFAPLWLDDTIKMVASLILHSN